MRMKKAQISEDYITKEKLRKQTVNNFMCMTWLSIELKVIKNKKDSTVVLWSQNKQVEFTDGLLNCK